MGSPSAPGHKATDLFEDRAIDKSAGKPSTGSRRFSSSIHGCCRSRRPTARQTDRARLDSAGSTRRPMSRPCPPSYTQARLGSAGSTLGPMSSPFTHHTRTARLGSAGSTLGPMSRPCPHHKRTAHLGSAGSTLGQCPSRPRRLTPPWRAPAPPCPPRASSRPWSRRPPCAGSCSAPEGGRCAPAP